MTVWKAGDRATYRYRFYVEGRRYEGRTGQVTQKDAEEFELEHMRRVRREAAGLDLAPEHSPRIVDWAETYYTYIARQARIRRPERIEELLRVVLRFWGARPPTNAVAGEPYRDLRLIDPIRRPEVIEEFDEWIRRRRIRVGTDRETGEAIVRPVSVQTRLHYFSVMSRLYRVATLPRFRRLTGVTVNPFADVERHRPPGRTVTVSRDELRRWLAHTPRHAQLAIAIAALIPKLRLQNVLALEWDRHFDERLQFVTLQEHKTVGHTSAPLVAAISPQARRWLLAAKRVRQGTHVIMYRGQAVHSIRRAVRAGAEASGLLYGRDVGGVTFHTIRHTAATLLAEMPRLTEAQRAAAIGHDDIATTQGYTHLRPVAERPIVAHLGRLLQLDDLADEAFGAAVQPAVPASRSHSKPPMKSRKRRTAAKSARTRRLA